MATYTVTHRQRQDNHEVLGLLTDTELSVGGTITVTGVTALYNGTHTIRALPQFLFLGVDNYGDYLYDYDQPIANQVLFDGVGDDETRTASTGTLTFTPTCTWVTSTQVTAWLNITVSSANDTALIAQATDAANQFAFRRRREASYVDSLTTAPSADVLLGTIMYAGSIYRARGTLGDTFAAFDGMGSAPMPGMPAMVKQLLGIDRPAVA